MIRGMGGCGGVLWLHPTNNRVQAAYKKTQRLFIIIIAIYPPSRRKTTILYKI
jgi:hypothetical protein